MLAPNHAFQPEAGRTTSSPYPPFLARAIHGFFGGDGIPIAPRSLKPTGDPAAMSNRTITVAAAQLGSTQGAEPRFVAVERMIRLKERPHHRGVELVVFPELAPMDLDSSPERDAPVHCKQ